MIRVLIVHENSILGAGFRMMLASEEDLQLVGEADAGTAGAAAVRLDPQVAIVDADSYHSGGLEVVRSLRTACPHLRIVMLGLHDGPETRAEALRAGASSFVSKQEPGGVLEEIRSVGRQAC